MTPTLSNQIAGQIRREEGLRRVRSEAARKAWRTRRRLTKPTRAMMLVLTHLAQKPDARICIRYLGRLRCGMSFHGPYTVDYKTRRVTYSTFRAMEKRGWLVFDSRRDSGGITGTMPDGSRGIVEPSYSLDYTLSEKGCKVWLATYPAPPETTNAKEK